MGSAGEKREYGTNCQRFDNRLGTRKHRATELFDERRSVGALLLRISYAMATSQDLSKLVVHSGSSAFDHGPKVPLGPVLEAGLRKTVRKMSWSLGRAGDWCETIIYK